MVYRSLPAQRRKQPAIVAVFLKDPSTYVEDKVTLQEVRARVRVRLQLGDLC